MELLLIVHMVLVDHVKGLCAEVRCVGMGGEVDLSFVLL